MEDIMTVMMITTTPTNPPNHPISDHQPSAAASPFPSWKLYENPFYISQNHRHKQEKTTAHNKQIHRLHLPVSARKIAASFWDLTFIRPFMESELDIARTQIAELKAELEIERKARKKMESANKKLAKELFEERREREALERENEELMKSNRAEINRMKKEIVEERKMLRVAEVLREERVQMKLNEAKIKMEEKMLELEEASRRRLCFLTEPRLQEQIGADNTLSVRRKASPEPENHHIRRGIKGFVEFPKVVRAIGSKSRGLGTKLECQKAQLKILMKQRSPIRSNYNLIMS